MSLFSAIRSRMGAESSPPSPAPSSSSTPPPASQAGSSTPARTASTTAISPRAPRGRAPAEIPPHGRVLVVGATRSGKTTWVLVQLLQLLRFTQLYVVILDTKGERPLHEFARRHRFTVAMGEAAGLREVRSSKRPHRLVVRCFDPLGDIANELLEALYNGSPGTVVFDEAMHWSTKSQIPRGARLLMTAGGGRHIGVWACSQRPVEVSNFFLSESSHRVLFKIELEDDQKKIAPLLRLRDPRAIDGLAKYHWLYKGDDPYEPVRHFAPVQLAA